MLRLLCVDWASPRYVAIAVVTVVICVVLLLLIREKEKPVNRTRVMVFAAVAISMSFVLSFFRLWKMPYGGSITPFSLLPLILFSYFCGVRRGVLAGLIYGVLQSIQDPWIVDVFQYLLDYPLAFSSVGLAGVFRHMKPRRGIILGVALVALGRFSMHFLSGGIYFGEYGVEFGIMNPWMWSFLYQITYVPIDAALSLVVAFCLLSSGAFVRQMDALFMGMSTKA